MSFKYLKPRTSMDLKNKSSPEGQVQLSEKLCQNNQFAALQRRKRTPSFFYVSERRKKIEGKREGNGEIERFAPVCNPISS